MYQKTVLENGLRVVTHDMKERNSIALGLWIAAGGRYEDDRIKGAAHFLEHISFKGSRKYGCEEIKQKIEGVGGALNAFTAEEATCYYAKIPSRHLPKTFDVLADMVFYPKINEEDVLKERTVILEELKMYHDLPQYYVMELLERLVWPNHPLGKGIVGTVESVSSMTNVNLRKFHQTYYSPRNIVIVACGELKHKDIVKMVKDKLAASLTKQDIPRFEKAPHGQMHAKGHFHHRDIEQMHLALGMLGYDQQNDDRYVLGLLSIILGGNMSSRLFNEVREKRGLAYSIGSSTKTYYDTGMFLVRAGVDNKKIVEAIKVIAQELNKVRQKGVTQDEFTRAKEYLLGQLNVELEDTMEHMLWLGDGVITKNRMRTLKSVIASFRKIKKQDITRVAREILNPKRFNLAIVGPVTAQQKKAISQLLNIKGE